MSDLKPLQIEKILMELFDLKEDLLDAKAMLKEFKIQSERLTQLQNAKKEIQAQIEEEKKRIEDEFMSDQDYKQAKADELKSKVAIKEKSGELKKAAAKIKTQDEFASYDYNIKGEMTKMQVEKTVKVYLNGKEAR